MKQNAWNQEGREPGAVIGVAWDRMTTFSTSRGGSMHVVGDQAIQSKALLITAVVQYSSHSAHVAAPTCTDGIKSPPNFEDLVGEQKYLICIFNTTC